jgi:hypothetical protein
MRLVVVAMLVACDLQPAPKPEASPPPPTPTVVVDAPVAPVPPPSPVPADAAIAPIDAGDAVSQPCLEMAVHVADVLIAAATEPTQKAVLEQERTRIVRRTGEVCSRGWSAEIIACFRAAANRPDLDACEKLVAPPKN